MTMRRKFTLIENQFETAMVHIFAKTFLFKILLFSLTKLSDLPKARIVELPEIVS